MGRRDGLYGASVPVQGCTLPSFTFRCKIKNFYLVLALNFCVFYGSEGKTETFAVHTNRLVVYNRRGECSQRGTD